MPTAVVVAAIIVFCAAAGYASFRLTVALLRPHYQLVIVSTTHTPKPRRITIRPHPRTSVIYLPAPAPVAPPPAPGPVASQAKPTHKPHPPHPPHPSTPAATPSETESSAEPSPAET